MLQQFLSTAPLSQLCFHQDDKNTDALGECPLETSEEYFSDCEDTEYMTSVDYANSPKQNLSGGEEDFPLTPSGLSNNQHTF